MRVTGNGGTGGPGGDRRPFRGICLGVPGPADYDAFKRLVAEVLPRHGCNTLVLLVRYRYAFRSHPDVSDSGALTADRARELAELAKAGGVRLIPKMNLLGHQSEKGGARLGLLRAHPEFDETPELDEVRYCRSLCPRHPDVKSVVCELADELCEAFEADAVHVGLDEVFEVGACPRCRASRPDELLAEWVEALHAHFAGEKGLEVLMWGDRFLDAEATGYGEWEASTNGTHPAIDRAPKGLVLCDWHYGKRADYPSIGLFTDKGFRTVVCPWKDAEATEALVGFAFGPSGGGPNERVLGTLCTSWCDSGEVARYLVDGDASVSDTARDASESFKRAMELTPR
ncbi:MAG: family 20 glycosylhydrolase [Planctomycetota bacterium]|jgi:hypothetical protein